MLLDFAGDGLAKVSNLRVIIHVILRLLNILEQHSILKYSQLLIQMAFHLQLHRFMIYFAKNDVPNA